VKKSQKRNKPVKKLSHAGVITPTNQKESYQRTFERRWRFFLHPTERSNLFLRKSKKKSRKKETVELSRTVSNHVSHKIFGKEKLTQFRRVTVIYFHNRCMRYFPAEKIFCDQIDKKTLARESYFVDLT